MFQRMFVFGLIVISLCVVKHAVAQDQSHLPPCTDELTNRHFPSGFDW